MSTNRLRTIDQLELNDRTTVLCRVDFNVPLNKGQVGDDTRVRAALPTIQRIRETGATVVLCSHLGRPKGTRVQSMSLLPVAVHLQELLDTDLIFSHDIVGDAVAELVRDQPPGSVILLENLRFDKREESGDDAFARELANLADVFVNDAFGALHRSHASITGVAKLLPSAAGLLVHAEVQALARLQGRIAHPYAAVLGGAKVSDKIGVIQALAQMIDQLYIGGAMAYTFMAARGEPTGSSKIDRANIEQAKELLATCADKGVQVFLPTDHVVADRFDQHADAVVVEQIPDGMMGLDIGPQTALTWQDSLRECRTIFWNGPMGVFEWPNFANGTKIITQALASTDGLTVVGGGDSAAAVATLGLTDHMTHVSTGGGASLALIEAGQLPGLRVLRRRA